MLANKVNRITGKVHKSALVHTSVLVACFLSLLRKEFYWLNDSKQLLFQSGFGIWKTNWNNKNRSSIKWSHIKRVLYLMQCVSDCSQMSRWLAFICVQHKLFYNKSLLSSSFSSSVFNSKMLIYIYIFFP